jgi:hypothetical protein
MVLKAEGEYSVFLCRELFSSFLLSSEVLTAVVTIVAINQRIAAIFTVNCSEDIGTLYRAVVPSSIVLCDVFWC